MDRSNVTELKKATKVKEASDKHLYKYYFVIDIIHNNMKCLVKVNATTIEKAKEIVSNKFKADFKEVAYIGNLIETGDSFRVNVLPTFNN